MTPLPRRFSPRPAPIDTPRGGLLRTAALLEHCRPAARSAADQREQPGVVRCGSVTAGEAPHVPTSRRAVPQQEHAPRSQALRSCRTSTTPSLRGSTDRAPRRHRRRPTRRRESDRQLRRHVQRGRPVAPPDRSPQRCVQPVAPPCSARPKNTPVTAEAMARDGRRRPGRSGMCMTRARRGRSGCPAVTSSSCHEGS